MFKKVCNKTLVNRKSLFYHLVSSCLSTKACANSKVLMKGDRVMKTKKLLMYLECINENLNTLILNQEMTYFIMREILKKDGQICEQAPC